MIDIVLYALLCSTVLSLLYYVFVLNHRIKNLGLTIVQKEIDLNIASERISELVELNLLTTNPDKDFIRFLSESREQAFSYIEVAQEAIAYLALAIKEEDADKLILAQNNLISLLPENMIK